jgi:hypothetical protein
MAGIDQHKSKWVRRALIGIFCIGSAIAVAFKCDKKAIQDILAYLGGPTGVIIVGGLVTTIAGFLVSYRRNPPRLLVKRLTIASGIGGVMTILGGVWTGYQQDQADKILIAKTDRIAELTQKNADYMTGGNSYCYFHFAICSNKVIWCLAHNGDYPLHDLEIRILDLVKRKKLDNERPGYITANYNREAESIRPYGTLSPHDDRSIFNEEELTTDEIKLYRVTFYARNGSWHENVCFVKKDGKWKIAWHLSLRSSITHVSLPYEAKTREGSSDGFPDDLLNALRQ